MDITVLKLAFDDVHHSENIKHVDCAVTVHVAVCLKRCSDHDIAGRHRELIVYQSYTLAAIAADSQ